MNRKTLLLHTAALAAALIAIGPARAQQPGHNEAVAPPHTPRHGFQAAIFLAASNKFHHQLVFNCPLLNCAVQLRTRDDDG